MMKCGDNPVCIHSSYHLYYHYAHKKEHNQPRAVSAAGAKHTGELPILGAIAAGQPIEEIEIPEETITITRDEIGKQGKHYALRVQGSSMIDEGIFDGDIVDI